ncbi:MAG: hypothetical protein HY560_05125 [Gemmatimonadetes bacterium]|nr:hypothetical protein [Gemmatimonadota bacterium]
MARLMFATAMLAAFAALSSPAIAQDGRVQIFGYGGAMAPLASLDVDGFREFKAGIDLGLGIAFWLDQNVGVRVDGSFATSKMQCATIPGPTGAPVNACYPDESGASWKKLFLGADLLLRGVTARGLNPYAYLGVGGGRLDEAGERIPTATRPTARFGAGLGYAPPGGTLGFLFETGLLIYDFKQTIYPFYNQIQIDAAFRAGVSFTL